MKDLLLQAQRGHQHRAVQDARFEKLRGRRIVKRLAEERGERETLTAERRRALAAWNLAFPELHMSEREYLAR